MARKLHVSSGTIWNRIRSMYASGFLLGSSVYFNPSLLGLKGGAYAFDVPSLASKIQIIERLKLLDYVLFIHNFSGTLVGIFFVYMTKKKFKGDLRRFKHCQEQMTVFFHM
jgi:DNA-binding Lrp family transcriptional regulator